MNSPHRFPRSPFNHWTLVSMFLISVVVIAFQLLLLRTLAVTHYYHFTYLVISTALLGFGASGTLLTLFYDFLKRNFAFWNLLFLWLFLLSIPGCYLVAERLPLDTQYVLYSWHQVGVLVGYNLLMLIPFLLGGLIIGFMITYYRREVSLLYGVNLAGSGAGGAAALGLMALVPAHQLPFVIAPLVFLSMVFFLISTGVRSREEAMKAFVLMTAGLLVTMLSLVIDPPDSVDPYKDLSHFRQLELQEDAEHVTRRFGPRAQIDVYESPTFHYTLFAGPQATAMPPPQLAVLMDGSVAAPLFVIEREEQAEILDYTPQSLPHRLLDRPNVLLLGESTGINVWMALRQGAEQVTVVQTNPQLIQLLRRDLADRGGAILDDNRVQVIQEDPRTYLERSDEYYNLIQFVAGEEMTGGTGGLQGLNENFLLTQQSVERALDRLEPDGLLSISRGIQSPARDNLKIASLFIDAGRSYGFDQPSNHLLMSRNYLAANTLLARSPVDDSRRDRYLEASRELQLDLEYYPGIESSEIDQRNRIEGPDGAGYSWLHHGVREMLGEDPEPFYSEWVYHVRTPTDDSPYFHDFFKWDSLDRFVEAYGDQWFQRLELGYVILLITLVQLAIVAFLLILLPLVIRWRDFMTSGNKMPTLLHFSMIGIGFMFLEITFIQTFTRFLGDPVISAAAVICSILIFSGAGSMLQKRVNLSPVPRILLAVAAVIISVGLHLLLSEFIVQQFVGLAIYWRFALTLLLLAPVSFFLGWLFPSAVDLLGRRDRELIPWAWGVDGFASVTAAPMAILLSMSIGFTGVLILGMACYLVAGLTSLLWKTG